MIRALIDMPRIRDAERNDRSSRVLSSAFSSAVFLDTVRDSPEVIVANKKNTDNAI